MRMFVTLCTLLALAQAKPQGYNYGSGVSGTLTSTGSTGHSGTFLTAPSNTHNVASYGPLGAFQSASVGSLVGGGGGASRGASTTHYNSAPAATNTYSQGGSSGHAVYGGGSSYNGGASYNGGGSYNGGSASSGFTGFGPSPAIGFGSLAGYQAPSYQQQQQEEQQAAFEAPIIHKQFITVAAAEDHENLERVKHLVIGRPQKNYRVVFIKAPSSSSANVKLSAEYAPKEEKTVIYVLSKKDSSLEVNDIATPAPTVPSKPEVFFIKYKTDAEASHAQQQIQAEYDRIEGTSEHTDGGLAPAQSVVGILDGGISGSGSSVSTVTTGGSGAGSTGGAYGIGSTSGGFSSGSTGGAFSSGSSGSHTVISTGTGSGHTGGSVGSGSGTVHKSSTSSVYLPPSH